MIVDQSPMVTKGYHVRVPRTVLVVTLSGVSLIIALFGVSSRLSPPQQGALMRHARYFLLGFALLMLTGCPSNPSASESADSNSSSQDEATESSQAPGNDVVAVPEGESGPREVDEPGSPSVDTPTRRSESGSVLMLPSRPPNSFRLNVGQLEPPKLKPLNIGGGDNSSAPAGAGESGGQDEPSP
jgi:hypothetical protein